MEGIDVESVLCQSFQQHRTSMENLWIGKWRLEVLDLDESRLLSYSNHVEDTHLEELLVSTKKRKPAGGLDNFNFDVFYKSTRFDANKHEQDTQYIKFHHVFARDERLLVEA